MIREIDSQGRVNLSRRALFGDDSPPDPRPASSGGGNRDRGGDRGGRGGDRGPNRGSGRGPSGGGRFQGNR